MRPWSSPRHLDYQDQADPAGRRYKALLGHFGGSREGLDRLLVDFRGDLVFPFDPDYPADCRLSDLRFQFRPALIAYCICDSDVRICLQLSQVTRLPFRVRAGGHSGGGYSSLDGGIVIDVSKLNDVTVDPVAKTVTAGSGTLFSKLNATVETYKAHIPGAECVDVAVGGHMQGGGYGLTSRCFGMNSDHVVEMRVMLADGTIVKANKTTNSDLWWAMRGGTGNNFGVLLSATYELRHVEDVYGWRYYWRLTSDSDRQTAAEAMVKIQRMFVDAAPEFSIQVAVLNRKVDQAGTAELQLWVFGVYIGTKDQGKAAVAPIAALPGAVPDVDCEGSYSSVLAVLLKPWPYFPTLVPPPCGRTASRYTAFDDFEKYWTARTWKQQFDRLTVNPVEQWFYFWLEVYCGAINSYPLEKSAFIHRKVAFNVCFETFWGHEDEPHDPSGRRRRSQAFLDQWCIDMTPLWNGRVYQNYPGQPFDGMDYATAYWGDALPALMAVKRKYDPNRLFHFPEAVPDRPAHVSWPPQVVKALGQPIVPDKDQDIWSRR